MTAKNEDINNLAVLSSKLSTNSCSASCPEKLSDKSKQLYSGGLRAGRTGQEAPLGHLSSVVKTTREETSSYLSDSFSRILLGNSPAYTRIPGIGGRRTL